MRLFTALLALSLSAPAFSQDMDNEDETGWAIVIHGGAGVIERDRMDAETEAAYRDALNEALVIGEGILDTGGSSQEAVEQVIRYLEDDEKFNSGRGAVFTSAGRNELDASIMRGSDQQAGAVSSVTSVRHPISLAIQVMEHSPHVMLSGAGAETFAVEQGLEIIHPSHFFTERRWQSMLRAVERMGMEAPARPDWAPDPEPVNEGMLDQMESEHAFGTVGVVAMDINGVVVAGTSTGGTTAKRWGRVGDSPIIGAGTYAAGSCGVSATGTGEYFIRLSVAARICWRAEAMNGQEAADSVIHNDLTELGGDGGIVMLYDGQTYWSFNTPGMYRASLVSDGEPIVEIFGDE